MRRWAGGQLVLRKETEGHLANRLASALFREAAHLIEQGVASVEDVDAAVSYGPGLRWAIMGPCLTYHLGGGAGGITHYLEHLGPSQARRWASLGNPSFGPEMQAAVPPKACWRRRPAAPSRSSRRSATVRWSASLQPARPRAGRGQELRARRSRISRVERCPDPDRPHYRRVTPITPSFLSESCPARAYLNEPRSAVHTDYADWLAVTQRALLLHESFLARLAQSSPDWDRASFTEQR